MTSLLIHYFLFLIPAIIFGLIIFSFLGLFLKAIRNIIDDIINSIW